MPTQHDEREPLWRSEELQAAIDMLRCALGHDGGYVDAILERAEELVLKNNPRARGLTIGDVIRAIHVTGPFGTPLVRFRQITRKELEP